MRSKNNLVQSFLDLGQKGALDYKTCSFCGMVYNCAVGDSDERTHNEYCAKIRKQVGRERKVAQNLLIPDESCDTDSVHQNATIYDDAHLLVDEYIHPALSALSQQQLGRFIAELVLEEVLPLVTSPSLSMLTRPSGNRTTNSSMHKASHRGTANDRGNTSPRMQVIQDESAAFMIIDVPFESLLPLLRHRAPVRREKSSSQIQNGSSLVRSNGNTYKPIGEQLRERCILFSKAAHFCSLSSQCSHQPTLSARQCNDEDEMFDHNWLRQLLDVALLSATSLTAPDENCHKEKVANANEVETEGEADGKPAPAQLRHFLLAAAEITTWTSGRADINHGYNGSRKQEHASGRHGPARNTAPNLMMSIAVQKETRQCIGFIVYAPTAFLPSGPPSVILSVVQQAMNASVACNQTDMHVPVATPDSASEESRSQCVARCDSVCSSLFDFDGIEVATEATKSKHDSKQKQLCVKQPHDCITKTEEVSNCSEGAPILPEVERTDTNKHADLDTYRARTVSNSRDQEARDQVSPPPSSNGYNNCSITCNKRSREQDERDDSPEAGNPTAAQEFTVTRGVIKAIIMGAWLQPPREIQPTIEPVRLQQQQNPLTKMEEEREARSAPSLWNSLPSKLDGAASPCYSHGTPQQRKPLTQLRLSSFFMAGKNREPLATVELTKTVAGASALLSDSVQNNSHLTSVTRRSDGTANKLKNKGGVSRMKQVKNDDASLASMMMVAGGDGDISDLIPPLSVVARHLYESVLSSAMFPLPPMNPFQCAVKGELLADIISHKDLISSLLSEQQIPAEKNFCSLSTTAAQSLNFLRDHIRAVTRQNPIVI